MDGVRIPLRNKRGEVVAYALIDEQDAAQAERRWFRATNGYVVRRAGVTLVSLHREVMGLAKGDGVEVDHINLNKLDNRRENLRLATRAQNAQNVPARGGTSEFRGVSWDARRGCWRAQAGVGGQVRFIGAFANEWDADAACRSFRARHMPYANEVRA